MAAAERKQPGADEFFPLLEDPEAEPMDLRRMSVEEALAADTPFTELIRIWADRRTEALAPEWDAFDFADFRGWHSHLCITVFPGDEPDPEFRIMGEAWVATGGASVTGVTVGQAVPRLYRLQLREHFQAIRDTGCVGLSVGRVAFVDRGFMRIQILELPVARDGKPVGGMIHGLHIEN